MPPRAVGSVGFSAGFSSGACNGTNREPSSLSGVTRLILKLQQPSTAPSKAGKMMLSDVADLVLC